MSRLQINILGQILLLCTFITSAVWVYLVHNNLLAAILLIGVVVAVIFWLFYDLNRVNRKIAFFFEAVQNEDMSFRFPEETTSSTTQYLHREMNRVNRMIQQTKIKQIEQEQFFQLAMNHAATGLLTLNEDGFIPFANQAAKELLHYPQLSHVNQLKQIDINLFQAVEQMNATERRMISFSIDQSERELMLYATSFRNQNEYLRIISIQNLKSELDQKESEAWIKLIRVLSHEMVNTVAPLSSLAQTLSGYFQSLPSSQQAEISMPAQHAKNTLKGLRVIQERGKGLVDFIEKYRQLTRLPMPQRQTIVLADLIDQLKILLSNESNFSSTSFTVDITPNDLTLDADKAQFSQVLLNLLLNALQALKEREDAVLKLKAFRDQEKKIHIGIIDNGPGISPEHLSEIFIPFFTTKENGSGIGLSLSRQIIQQHGMSLEVQSRLGEGASFWIRGS